MKAKASPTATNDLPLPPNVIEAERFYRGLLITFESGEIAFYSADLLHQHLENAVPFDLATGFRRLTAS